MFELKKQVADQQSRLQTLQSQLDESQRTIAEQTKIMHQQTQALERESGKETEMETLRQKADTVDTLIEVHSFC
jgi:TolA-binding protein